MVQVCNTPVITRCQFLCDYTASGLQQSEFKSHRDLNHNFDITYTYYSLVYLHLLYVFLRSCPVLRLVSRYNPFPRTSLTLYGPSHRLLSLSPFLPSLALLCYNKQVMYIYLEQEPCKKQWFNSVCATTPLDPLMHSRPQGNLTQSDFRMHAPSQCMPHPTHSR